MSIKDKIEIENGQSVYCYKQGAFWVVYEQSAYYIWQLKGFKPTKKWYKNILKEVVQVGFPNTEEVLKTNIALIKDRNNALFQYGYIEAQRNKTMIYRILNTNSFLK